MPKSKPKLEARVTKLRDQLALSMGVSEFESCWDKTFNHTPTKTKDGFIVTDKDGRKYEVKICPVDR